MAKLDGVSKELYPGEISGFMRKYVVRRRPAGLDPRTDFRIHEVREVERRVASGSKVVYKNKGSFRG